VVDTRWVRSKIAKAFHVAVMLEDFYFSEGTECTPGSIQAVIYMSDGERQYSEWPAESERPQPVHLLWALPDEDLVIDPLGTQSKTETPGRTAPPARNPGFCSTNFFPMIG
jgi:hypothetical protein